MPSDPVRRVSVDELAWHSGHGLYTYEGTPFTGVAFEIGRTGTLEWETEYRDGVKHGLQRGWHLDGQPAAEGTFRNGGLHGTYREWHTSGQPAAEEVGEHGILLSAKKWDESGQLMENYSIEVGGPDWQTLELCREIYGTSND